MPSFNYTFKSFRLFTLLIIVPLLFTCKKGDDGQPDEEALAHLQSKEGRVLFFTGQDLDAIAEYQSECEECPKVSGVSTYVGLKDIFVNDYYGGLGFTENDEALGRHVDWGAGRINSYELAEKYQAIHMGLYTVGSIESINNGELDNEIVQLADFFNHFPKTAFYLRIGWEFDGFWSNYEPVSWKLQYKRIVDIIKEQNVKNVAFVWQSAASPIDDMLDGEQEDLAQWYPGDDYVDWVGFSWFESLDQKSATQAHTPATQRELIEEILAMARLHNKPVMIPESCPQGYDLARMEKRNISAVWDGEPGTGAQTVAPEELWDSWYKPWFELIDKNKDVIKGVTTINANWDAQSFWSGPPYNNGYWGDSRIQANDYIEEKWSSELQNNNWIKGDEDLQELLSW